LVLKTASAQSVRWEALDPKAALAEIPFDFCAYLLHAAPLEKLKGAPLVRKS